MAGARSQRWPRWPSSISPCIWPTDDEGWRRMPTLMQKALAYITWGNTLLVFSHPDFPEAGIQVPAGTIEPGEEPEAGALREAFEETGLSGLALVAFLGEQMR